MSNLAKIEEKEICPSLSKTEIEIVKSSQTVRIFNLSDKEIDVELKNSIGQAILIIGNKSLYEDDILMMIIHLRDYIKEKHQYSKIGEILQAIKLGSFGEYLEEGKVLYITPANIIQWIRMYDERKEETLSKQVEFEKEKEREEMERLEKERKEKEYYDQLPINIKNCVDDRSSPMASIYFRELWSLKLIEMDSEELKVVKDRAKEEIASELKARGERISKINAEELEEKYKNRAAKKSFYLWIEENKENDIEKIVREALNER